MAGSGDGNTGITLQSMQSLVSRFGITSDLDGFNGDNAAAVMITADLPPFTKPGQAIDVTVSTVGGATSRSDYSANYVQDIQIGRAHV